MLSSPACVPVCLPACLPACLQEDEDFAQANQTASEAFGNIRTIAAFGMEGQVGGWVGGWVGGGVGD